MGRKKRLKGSSILSMLYVSVFDVRVVCKLIIHYAVAFEESFAGSECQLTYALPGSFRFHTLRLCSLTRITVLFLNDSPITAIDHAFPPCAGGLKFPV